MINELWRFAFLEEMMDRMSSAKRMIVFGVILFLNSAYATTSFPVGSACDDERQETKSVAIEKVDVNANSLIVTVKMAGTVGMNPEYSVVVISTNSAPRLDVIAAYGKTGKGDTRSSIGKFDNSGKAMVRFTELDPNVAYSVYAMGYRCKLETSLGGNNYKTKWITSFVYQVNFERNVYKAQVGTNDCLQSRPIVERVDFDKMGAKQDQFATLLRVRQQICQDGELESGDHYPFETKVAIDGRSYVAGNELITIASQLSSGGLRVFSNDLLSTVTNDPNVPYSEWRGYSFVDGGGLKWGENFILIPGRPSNIDISMIGGLPSGESGTKFDGYNYYYSLPLSSGSDWVRDASRDVVGILNSPKTNEVPDFNPPIGKDLDLHRFVAAVVVMMRGVTEMSGGEFKQFLAEGWGEVKKRESISDAFAILLGSGTYSLNGRLKNGLKAGMVIDFIQNDALLSADGWTLISSPQISDISSMAKLAIQTSKNVDLYVKNSSNQFLPLAPNDAVSKDGSVSYSLDMAGKVGSPVGSIYTHLHERGLWGRAKSSAVGFSQVESSNENLESYLLEMCLEKSRCIRMRGGVDRKSSMVESVNNSPEGIRRRNVAEMLPNERRDFTLSRNLLLPSSAVKTAIKKIGCSGTGGIAGCPFTVATSTLTNNSFSVSATSTAKIGEGVFWLELSNGGTAQSENNKFILEMRARILGSTQLLVSGPLIDANDNYIVGARKASQIYRDYLVSLGDGLKNIVYVDCGRYLVNGGGCGDYLNAVVARYAGGQNKLARVVYFGHGSGQGFPIVGDEKSWVPNPSATSFEKNASFIEFSCRGGLEPGILAFSSAWRISVIGDLDYTIVCGGEYREGQWDMGVGRNRSATDVVFFSSKYMMDDPRATQVSQNGSRRGIIGNEPYNFILANPVIDPQSGAVTLEKSRYALEDFKIFKVGESVNFPVVVP